MLFTGNPKLKSTVQFYEFDGSVFFASAGTALQMEDSAGFLATLCQQLDGAHEADAIHESLMASHPEQACYLTEALGALNEAHLLENAAVMPSTDLNEHDLKRWSRNTEFFGSFTKYHDNKYQAQAQLKKVKVVLLGLGGLGSHLLFDLAALGVHHIKAVDFDRVELSNLNRQILYRHQDIGLLKTEAAQKRIHEFLPDGQFEFINQKLESQQDVEDVVKGADVVICVADRPRKDMLSWLNHSCVKWGIPYINGGIDTKRAMLFSVLPGKSACSECWQLHVAKQDTITSQLHQREMQEGPQAIPGPAVVSFVSTLTGLMLTEFLKIVTGIAPLKTTNQLTMFDFEALSLSPVEAWQRQADCSVCADELTRNVK